MAQKDVLQPVDAAATRQAKTFLRVSRHAALATLAPDSGTPMASRVALASDSAGHPVFLISQLSGHFGALVADPRASLLLGEPGRGDPLAHPRITVFGRAERVEEAERPRIRSRFLARHPKAALYVDFADFAFWRLRLDGASLNAGFGKAFALGADDLLAPVDPALDAMAEEAVAHMNADHRDATALYAQHFAQAGEGAWQIACIDTEGMDLTDGDAVARVWFDPALPNAEALRPRLVAMAKRARGAG